MSLSFHKLPVQIFNEISVSFYFLLARPTIVSRHLINFDLGKHFMKEGVYEPLLYYMDLFVL